MSYDTYIYVSRGGEIERGGDIRKAGERGRKERGYAGSQLKVGTVSSSVFASHSVC